MIYDPQRAALDLKQRILESMTPKEFNEYARLRQLETEPVTQSPDDTGDDVSAPTDQ